MASISMRDPDIRRWARQETISAREIADGLGCSIRTAQRLMRPFARLTVYHDPDHPRPYTVCWRYVYQRAMVGRPIRRGCPRWRHSDYQRRLAWRRWHGYDPG